MDGKKRSLGGVIRLLFPMVDIDDAHLGWVADQLKPAADTELAHDADTVVFTFFVILN